MPFNMLIEIAGRLTTKFYEIGGICIIIYENIIFNQYAIKVIKGIVYMLSTRVH